MGSRHSFNDWNGFQYNQLEETSNQVVSTEIQKLKLKRTKCLDA
jgi:hypothetical protein